MNDYQVGGSLSTDTPSYVIRSADLQLYQALKQGEFCYILDARQMGKSSLMVKMMHYLRKDGYCCSALDMTRIGGEIVTPAQWYKGLIVELLQGFNLFGKVDFKAWWHKYQSLSPIQILSLFIEEVLLAEMGIEDENSPSSIVVFFDEIDSVLSLNFSVDDFFALIRFCYNQRSLNPKYKRLTFVLIGVATPFDLISDHRRTPFNIGKAIKLGGFQYDEARPLQMGLAKTISNPEIILQRILYWTNGQPFLTQKLCQLVSSFSPPTSLANYAGWLDRLIETHVISNWQSQDEPEHLKTIRDRLLHKDKKIGSRLNLYQQILTEEFISADNSLEHQELLLSGLIIKEDGGLKVRNPIYRQVFDLPWLEGQISQLRPYSESLRAWQKSDCTDNSRLLRGKALEDAQEWSLGKNLSELEYQFLASSEQLNRKEIQQALEAERAKEIEARLVEKQKTTKLQRYFIFTLSLAFVTVLGFGTFAYKQNFQANLNEIMALINYSQALFASNKRLEALVTSIAIKQKWQKLNHQEDNIDKEIESVLRQAVFGVDEYNRLSGHSRTVFGMDISGDDQRIVTSSADQTVKLWQADGTLIKTFQDHQAAVWDVAFSPDGKTIASASRDRTIKLWHQDRGLLKTIAGHQDDVLGIAFSPDGKTIASASRDKTIRLWNRDGELIDTLKDHQEAVWKAVFSPDGKTLVTASEDKTIKLWQLNPQGRFELAQTLTGHSRQIRNVIFSPDGQLIASASHDHTVKIWQSKTGKLLRTLNSHKASVIGISFSPDGQLIASGSWDNTIKIWNLKGNLLKTISVGKKRIWDLAFCPDGNSIGVASGDMKGSLVRVDNPFLKILRDHSEPVIDVAFSPDGKTIASASDDHTVKLWDSDGSLFTTFKGKQDSVLGVAWSPEGNELVSGHWNGALKFLQLNEVKDFPIHLDKTIEAHRVGVWRVAFSPNRQLIATASEDLTAKIWDRQGNLISTLQGHQDIIRGIAISPDSKLIATASGDRTVKIWNIEGDILASIKNNHAGSYAVDFSPDGMMMVTGNNDGTIKLWNINRIEGKVTLSLIKTLTSHLEEVRQVAFSPNSELIASASGDRTIKIWHRSGRLLKTLYGHGAEVWSLDFSPDGKKIVSSSEDKTVIIWNLQDMFDLDLVAAGCSQIIDYLRTNPEVSASDRSLCDHVDLSQN